MALALFCRAGTSYTVGLHLDYPKSHYNHNAQGGFVRATAPLYLNNNRKFFEILCSNEFFSILSLKGGSG